MRFLVILFTLSIVHSSYGQHNFLYERQSLKEIKAYEDSISSKYLGYIKTNVAKDYFPTALANHDYYPLSFIRTNDSFFPELHLEYFYNEIDSTLLSTSYDWNIMDYVKNI